MKAVLEMPLPAETPPVAATPRLRRGAWPRAHPRSASLAAYVALSFLLFSATWVHPFTHVIGVADGDPTGFFWALAWPVFALTHGHNLLFTDYLYAPAGVNLLWTYPPLPPIIMAPVTALAGPVFAYNLLTTLGIAGSGWLMALATHRFVRHWAASFVAGLLFGFGPFALGQALDHVVLVLQFALPLLLLLLHEALIRQVWRPWRVGLAIGAVITAQLLTFAEGVAVLLIFVALGLGMAWLLRDREAWPARRLHARRALLLAVAATAVLSAYPLAFMLAGPQHVSGGSNRLQWLTVSNLANVVVPGPTQLVSPTHDLGYRLSPMGQPNPAEWNAYLGLPLLILCLVVAVRGWADRTVRFAVLMATAALVLSCGPSLSVALGVVTPVHLPAELLGDLPFLGNIVWSRLAVVMDLFVALVLAWYIARPHGTRPLRVRWRHCALLAAVGVSLLPVLPYPSAGAPPVPRFFAGGEVDRIAAGSVALVAPYTESGRDDNAEYWQAVSGYRFRLITAYAFVPGPQGAEYVPVTPLSRAMLRIQAGLAPPGLDRHTSGTLLAELRRDAVRTVIVGPTPNQAAMVEFMTRLLGRAPVWDQGVEVWWNVA